MLKTLSFPDIIAKFKRRLTLELMSTGLSVKKRRC